MLISEIFYSIQGEGELLGCPSIFVRTSGCNLRCCWCDTPYTSWNPEGKSMTVEEVIESIAEFTCKHIVLTGGEPMLAPEIYRLSRLLRELDYHITIETAATILPMDVVYDLASLSPKLSHSAPQIGHWQKKHEQIRYQPQVIRSWMNHGNYQLKFVVSSSSDIVEIEKILVDVASPIPPSKIFLMPQGTTQEELSRHNDWIVEACKEKGFRYAHRLHIELFGNTRAT